MSELAIKRDTLGKNHAISLKKNLTIKTTLYLDQLNLRPLYLISLLQYENGCEHSDMKINLVPTADGTICYCEIFVCKKQSCCLRSYRVELYWNHLRWERLSQAIK